MTNRGCKMKRIKLDPNVEDRYERVECREQENHKLTAKDEPVNFEFERIDFEADSHNEDSIDAILERKRAEEELPPVIIENLRNLRIRLRHNVPPQHQIERMAGSHTLSKEENEEFKKLVPDNRIRKGTFTCDEDELIVDNWEAFCEMHNWDKQNPKPFLCMRQHNGTFYLKRETERKKFVQFLADGLPSRTLYSVYHRFRILYDSKFRTKYTNQEDKYIINHIERNENLDKRCMFSDLAKALNRSRASVWRRYRLLNLKRKRKEAKSNDDQ